jgi:glycosyltransferase involved in cell wall biosynthesis
MKYFLIINNLSSGGGQRQCVNIANGLFENNNQVILVVLSCKENRKTFYLPLIHKGIIIKLYKPICKVFIPFYLAYSILQFRPNVVYNFLETANIWGTIISRIILGNSVIIANSILGMEKLNFKYFYLWKKLCDFVVCNSNCCKNYFIDSYKYPSDRLYVVYNPLVINNSDQISSIYNREYVSVQGGICRIKNKKIAINVGRITPIKNQFELIRAWERLSNKENYILLFIGQFQSNKYLNKLKSFISLKRMKNVFFTGEVINVHNFYKIANVLIQTSFSESLSNVIIEGMAFGLPILASDVGDTKAILDLYNHQHIIYKNGNIDNLKDSIDRMMTIANYSNIYLKRYVNLSFINDFSLKNRINETENIFINSIKRKNHNISHS